MMRAQFSDARLAHDRSQLTFFFWLQPGDGWVEYNEIQQLDLPWITAYLRASKKGKSDWVRSRCPPTGPFLLYSCGVLVRFTPICQAQTDFFENLNK